MSNIVTYSSAYTLVPTYECFNRCAYCNFRVDPGADSWLSLEEASNRLQAAGAIEALVLSGEVHPASDRRKKWIDHIYKLCKLSLDLGCLPHTNAGPLSWTEMEYLKQVNVSMGLMLEQLTPMFQQTVHRHAPSKSPTLRLQQLEWAGQLQIPFTTGLLLGLGETAVDWQETLDAIASLHRQYGHIQEVILQPHQPGQRQILDRAACHDALLLEAVSLAKATLPEDIVIQIPPNLIRSPEMLAACVAAGARDLGGIGPWDEVNPDYPHHRLHDLRQLLAAQGYELKLRLPVYPRHDRWLSASLQAGVQAWRQRLSQRLPYQEGQARSGL